jgi:hypothetical protein
MKIGNAQSVPTFYSEAKNNANCTEYNLAGDFNIISYRLLAKSSIVIFKNSSSITMLKCSTIIVHA